MKKKTMLLAAALAAVIQLSVPAYAFTDVDGETAYQAEITEFNQRGLLQGYPDGTFRPEAGLRRSEFITLINRTFGYVEGQGGAAPFSDAREDAWYAGHLRTAYAKGYIQGYPDGTFRPERLITRQEAAVVLNHILAYEPREYAQVADPVESWALAAVHSLLQEGIMTLEEGRFRGGDDITRGETVVSLLAVLKLQEQEEAEAALGGGSSSTDAAEDKEAEVRYALQLTVANLDAVLSGEASYAPEMNAAQLAVIGDVRDAIAGYLEDAAYDYESDMEDVRTAVTAFSAEEQEEIEYALKASVPFRYSGLLRSFFGL